MPLGYLKWIRVTKDCLLRFFINTPWVLINTPDFGCKILISWKVDFWKIFSSHSIFPNLHQWQPNLNGVCRIYSKTDRLLNLAVKVKWGHGRSICTGSFGICVIRSQDLGGSRAGLKKLYETWKFGYFEIYPLDLKIGGILSRLGGILKNQRMQFPSLPLDILGSERLWCESSIGLSYSCSPEMKPFWTKHPGRPLTALSGAVAHASPPGKVHRDVCSLIGPFFIPLCAPLLLGISMEFPNISFW